MITISLSRPIEAHGKAFSRIVLREPTVMEALRLGDPYTVAQTGDGVKFLAENNDAIESYLKLCIQEPEDPMIVLSSRRPDLARALKEGLFGFFHPADEDEPASGEESKTSSTSSPSPASATSPPTISIV